MISQDLQGEYHNMKNIFIITAYLILFVSGQAFAQRLAVTSSTANIRSGPGTNYEINWRIEKYHPVYVFEKTGNWYHFRDFEKDEGWIHKSLLGGIKTVITVRDSCNVRSGPGPKNNILFSIQKGIPFKVLGKKGSWINIQHADGDEGWIYKTLVW